MKLSILPLSVSQDVIQIGEKFARSYTASQSIELTVKDFSLIKRIIEQAISAEIGDIGGTEFALTSTSAARKSLRERVRKEANAKASAKAKELGRTLDKMVDFLENNNVYDTSDSDLEGEDEIGNPERNANGEEPPAEVSNHFGTIKVYQSVSVKYLTK